MNDLLNYFPKSDFEELQELEHFTREMDDAELETFARVYNARRKDSTTIVLLALVGFFAVAGIHRFMLNQIGWGIAYVLTAGFCGIGTIIDLVNHKDLTLDYNHLIMQRTKRLIEKTGI